MTSVRSGGGEKGRMTHRFLDGVVFVCFGDPSNIGINGALKEVLRIKRDIKKEPAAGCTEELPS